MSHDDHQNVFDLFPEETSTETEGELTTSQLGRYAEFMVCAELTKLGYYVQHCDAPGFDVILVVEKRSLRVQVKSTSSVKEGRCYWTCSKCRYSDRDMNNRGRRAIDKSDADLIALYHHVFGTTIYILPEDIRTATGGICLPVTQVREHGDSESLDHALRRIL